MLLTAPTTQLPTAVLVTVVGLSANEFAVLFEKVSRLAAVRWWTSMLALGTGAAGALGVLLLSGERSLELSLPHERIWFDESQDGTDVERTVSRSARRYLAVDVSLRAGFETIAMPAERLGFAVDEEATVRAVYSAWMERRKAESWPTALLRRLRGEPWKIDITPETSFSEDIAEQRLAALAPWVNIDPQDAQLLIGEHRVLPSREGRRLSPAASALRIGRMPLGQAGLVELVLEPVPPKVTEADLAPVDVSEVLASYETSFRGKAGARAINIRRAGAYLDGALIFPGEVLSFNERVGRRVHGRGFVDAPVIINDELEQDVGGGVCQVATTLHGAARYGNLEVVARRSHSRPSGYAPIGLDATVIDGKVDLRLRNPYDEPLLVHVSFPSTYMIRVELLGRRPEVSVKHSAVVTHTEPYARRVWHRAEVPAGSFKLKQKGSLGMDVVSILRIEQDGRVETRRYRSKYYPVPEVYWVAEGVRLSDLPVAPKEAVALVVNGEEVVPPDGSGSGDQEAGEGTAATKPGVTDTPSLDAPSDEVL